jgi:hypothetical protein
VGQLTGPVLAARDFKPPRAVFRAWRVYSGVTDEPPPIAAGSKLPLLRANLPYRRDALTADFDPNATLGELNKLIAIAGFQARAPE